MDIKCLLSNIGENLWCILPDIKNISDFILGAEGILNFEKDFKERNYKFSKGAVQFPINEDIPLELVNRIVEFRKEEIIQKKS